MQLQQHERELEQLEVQVLVVTFERPQLAANYVRATGWPWPVVTDEQRKLYHAYGMEKGAIWQLYGWPAWWAYFKLFAKGRWLKRPTGDVHQLGGDVIVDAEGIVRYLHVGRGPADRPPVEELLDVVRG